MEYESIKIEFAELLTNIKHWNFDINGNYKLCKKEANTIMMLDKLLKDKFEHATNE